MQAATGSVSWVATQPSVLGLYGGGGGAPSAAARGTARGGAGARALGVARCCARAQEKRPPRVRKTKEERRELVESFINSYRVSNGGKFPSVNLTHKEVGGSYYIVREIVRDIIQENKVLGPGGLDATALSFEDCPDSSELSGDSQVQHDSAPEVSHNEEFSLQNNVISIQTLLGSSNILEAGVLNRVVQNGSTEGTTCLETSLEKQDKNPSGGSVEVELTGTEEQGSPFSHASISDKETKRESLVDSDQGAISGVTNGVILSPEPTAAYETNDTILREHETLFDNNRGETTDGAVIGINLAEKTNGIPDTKQTTLQGDETLTGSVSSDDAQIVDDQANPTMDDFTSRTDSTDIEVPIATKTVELSNEHKLQDELEPSLLESSHDDQEYSKSLVSEPTLDTKEPLPVEGKHSVLQVDENDLKNATSRITTENEASNFKHDEGTSATTTISRRASKAQQKKEDNLFWLVLRAFVIAVSKLWTK